MFFSKEGMSHSRNSSVDFMNTNIKKSHSRQSSYDCSSMHHYQQTYNSNTNARNQTLEHKQMRFVCESDHRVSRAGRNKCRILFVWFWESAHIV